MALTLTETVNGTPLTVTADKGLAVTMLALRNAILGSKHWQALCGTGNGAKTYDALKALEASASANDARVALYAVPDEGASLTLPSCLICHEHDWLEAFIGTADTYESQGHIRIAFAIPIATAYLKSKELWYIDTLNKAFRLWEQIRQNNVGLPANAMKLGRIGELDPQEHNGEQAVLFEMYYAIRGTL